MPLYEFICRKCGAFFDEICQADAEAPMCPQCGSKDTQRQISMPSPLKKGGFPLKPGPVHPLANRLMNGPQGCASCGGACPGKNELN